MPQSAQNRHGIKIESKSSDPVNLQDLVYQRANNKINDEETWRRYDQIVRESKNSLLDRFFYRLRSL